MPQQMNMFDPEFAQYGTPAKELVRARDPSTSVDAALSVDSATLEMKVFDVIKSFGVTGCISDQIVDALHPIGVQTVSPRYKSLKKKSLVEETGEKRLGKSGRNQMVLRAL